MTGREAAGQGATDERCAAAWHSQGDQLLLSSAGSAAAPAGAICLQLTSNTGHTHTHVLVSAIACCISSQLPDRVSVAFSHG